MARESGKVRARSAAKTRGSNRAEKSGAKRNVPEEGQSRSLQGREGEDAPAPYTAERQREMPATASGRIASQAGENNARKVSGIFLLFIAVPFLLCCLCIPELVGSVGVWLNEVLYAKFGVASWTAPLLCVAGGLLLLISDGELAFSIKTGVPFLTVGMVLASGRMGRHAGAAGNAADELITGFVGPFGAWMAAVLALAAGLCWLWHITPDDILELLKLAGQILEKLFRGIGRFSVWLSKVVCKGVAGAARHIKNAVESFYSQGSVYNENSRLRSRNRLTDKQARQQERAKQANEAVQGGDVVPERPIGLVKFDSETGAGGSAERSADTPFVQEDPEKWKQMGDFLSDGELDDCLFGWDEDDAAGQDAPKSFAEGRGAAAGTLALPAVQGNLRQQSDASYYASVSAVKGPAAESNDEIERAAKLGSRLRQSTAAAAVSKKAENPIPQAVSGEDSADAAVGRQDGVQEKGAFGRPSERLQPPAVSDEKKAELRKRLFGCTIPRTKHVQQAETSFGTPAAAAVDSVKSLPVSEAVQNCQDGSLKAVISNEIRPTFVQPASVPAAEEALAAEKAVDNSEPHGPVEQPAEEDANLQRQNQIRAAKAEACASWIANQERLRKSFQRQAQRKRETQKRAQAGVGEVQAVSEESRASESSLQNKNSAQETAAISAVGAMPEEKKAKPDAAAAETQNSDSKEFWGMPALAAKTSESINGTQAEKGKSKEIGQVVVRPSSYNPLSEESVRQEPVTDSSRGKDGPESKVGKTDSQIASAPGMLTREASSAAQPPSALPQRDSALPGKSVASKSDALRSFWSGKTIKKTDDSFVKPVWAAVGVGSAAHSEPPQRAGFPSAARKQDAELPAPLGKSAANGVSAVPAASSVVPAEREGKRGAEPDSKLQAGGSASLSAASRKDRLRDFWGGKRGSGSLKPAPEAGDAVPKNDGTTQASASVPLPSPARTMGRGRNVWAELAAKKQTESASIPQKADSRTNTPSSEPVKSASVSSKRMLGNGRNVWADLEAKKQTGASEAKSAAGGQGISQTAKPERAPAAARTLGRGRSVWADLENKKPAAAASPSETFGKDGTERDAEAIPSDPVSVSVSASSALNLPRKTADILPAEALSDMPTVAEDSDSASEASVSDSESICADDGMRAAKTVELDIAVNNEGKETADGLIPLSITEEDYNDADDGIDSTESGRPQAGLKTVKGLGAPRLEVSLPAPAGRNRLGVSKLGLGGADSRDNGKTASKPLLKKDAGNSGNTATASGLNLPSFLTVKRGGNAKTPLTLNWSRFPGKSSQPQDELPSVRRVQSKSLEVKASLPITDDSVSGKPTVGSLALNIHPVADGKSESDIREANIPKPAEAEEAERPVPAASVPKVLNIGGSKNGAPVSYRLPSISLLNKPEPGSCLERDEDQSELLVDALASFKVSGKVVNVVHGPAVTRYEVEPARGVSVKKFTSLRDDLALRLAAKTLRVEAPVPGASVVGIEVPNKCVEMVSLYDVIASDSYRGGKGLCFGLGKDIAGKVQVADLGKMPHLLIAGTTGSGKSVCINTIILSLIYRFTPSNLQMLMIDPKQVELSIYEGIPHLIGLADDDAKIVCDAKKAAIALNQMVELMEMRYALFAKQKVRNLKEYNAKAETKLPWVVVIIDELADLIMVAQKPVETAICRLAQKARAAGILMIVATQRPSADVLTGLIRSNIPSRISFAVPSQFESRIILDAMGAEDLLGKGDMLFKPLDAPAGIRIQGAFVSNEEIERVVAFWSTQAAPENRIEISVQEEPETSEGEDNSGDSSGDADEDMIQNVLSDIASGTINRDKGISASSLQSMYRIGYSRARRLVEQMEKRGYIGPQNGSKPREIYYSGT